MTRSRDEDLNRSTELAAERTMFAAERTYAAWMRTGLAALASGIGVKALMAHILPGLMAQFASTILTLFSIFCFCAAVWRETSPTLRDPVCETRRIPKAVLFIVNGALVAVAAAILISIWLGPYGAQT